MELTILSKRKKLKKVLTIHKDTGDFKVFWLSFLWTGISCPDLPYGINWLVVLDWKPALFLMHFASRTVPSAKPSNNQKKKSIILILAGHMIVNECHIVCCGRCLKRLFFRPIHSYPKISQAWSMLAIKEVYEIDLTKGLKKEQRRKEYWKRKFGELEKVKTE